MNYTRQTDFTDLRETLNKIDNILTESKFNDGFPDTSKEIEELIKYAEEKGNTAELEELYHALEQRLNAEEGLTESVLTEREVSITTLNRWAKYAKDVADYMGNQLSRGDTIPTAMDSFLKNSGYSDERKQAIKDDPYYFNNIKKVALAVNNNDLNSLGNTGPKTEMGTSFGGGGDATVTGRERQIKLDPALRNLQGLAKEKDNASNTTEYYSPMPPEDLNFVLHGAEADPIELSGSLSDTVEPTWHGQTADEIRDELDATYGGRENWINNKEWDMGDGVISTFDRTGKNIPQIQRTDPARDPAGQIITDPESDTPLETPMDWDMDDINTQFANMEKQSDKRDQSKADLKAELEADMEIERKREQRQADLRAELEADMEIENMTRDDWKAKFDSMSADEFADFDTAKFIANYSQNDNATDGFLDSKFDRKDNASIKAVDNEINDLNKAMASGNTDTEVNTVSEPEVVAEPEVVVNYGDMSDEDYEKAYYAKMNDLIASGYDITNPEYDEKAFDDDMWKQLGKLDSVRASQKKDSSDDKRAEWDMNRATDQFAKLDKEITDREAKAKDNKERAQMYLKMRDAEQAQADMETQYDKDNPEGIDKISQQAGKAWDEIKKTGSELGDYAEIDKVADTVAKGAGDAYDYVTKGGINKDASKLKKYIQSPQAGKDAEAKGKEHKAYLDKKAGDVGDYFTGGEFGKDVDDASDWISSQWNSLFSNDKKESVAKNTTTDKPS